MGVVTALEGIGEVLPCPRLTRVPGTRQWVLGVVAIRGAIVTVMDVSAYLFGTPTPVEDPARILLVEQDGIAAGLLLPAVLGMRHFDEQEWSEEPPEAPAEVSGYLRGSFQRGSERWGVFDLHALVTNPGFLQVAA